MVKKSYLNVLHLQDLNVNEKLSLLFLINEDSTSCNNSNQIVALHDFITIMLGISKSSVCRSLKKLNRLGYISWTKRNYDDCSVGYYNVYHINYDKIHSKLGMNNVIEQEF